MGLNRSWTVACPLTDATVYCVLSGGITVCWGHSTFCQYFEAVVEVGILRIGHGDCFCSQKTGRENTGVTHWVFCASKLAISRLADEVTWEKDKETVT